MIKKAIKIELANINAFTRLMEEAKKDYVNFNNTVPGIIDVISTSIKKGDDLVAKYMEITKMYGALKKAFDELGLNFDDYPEFKVYRRLYVDVVGVKNLTAAMKSAVNNFK